MLLEKWGREVLSAINSYIFLAYSINVGVVILIVLKNVVWNVSLIGDNVTLKCLMVYFSGPKM